MDRWPDLRNTFERLMSANSSAMSKNTHFWLTLCVGLFCFWVTSAQAVDVPLDPALRMQDELRRAERAMPTPAPTARPSSPPSGALVVPAPPHQEDVFTSSTDT